MNGGWIGPGLGLSGLAILGLGMVAGLGVMQASSSSTFCGSCHIMETYHASWSESTHKDVACVACHIPAGVGAGLQKKLDGLSMLAMTVKGESSSHLSSHIADDVCLRCHERRLLVGQEWFGSVLFDHRPHLTELRRGVQLNCSSCHSQIVQGDHITVTSSSCLVCHFLKREPGATEAECGMCHQVDGLVAERGDRRFDHARSVELGIDCESCHEPMPVEANMVPRERCLTCHNRPERLAKTADPPALMSAHIRQNRAQCGECHQELHHVGKRRNGIELVHCEGCDQPSITPPLVLYADLDGGAVGPMVSPMYAAGVRCEGCHPDPSDMLTKPATSVSCLQCHPLGIERLFEWWRQAVDERQAIARKLFQETVAELGPASSSVLNKADREIQTVEQGAGVHNLQLAMSLLDSAVDRIAQARIAEGLVPIQNPWPPGNVDSKCYRCHRGTESRSMVTFGRNFGHASHVDAGKLECEKCHSNHEQRDHEGMAALLLGEPKCQGCHHEKIDIEKCSSCHDDLHRAEFADALCSQCHAADFWRPAPGFDHQTTKYALTGGHVDLACAKCHPEESTGGIMQVRYRGLRYERCEDCHQDPHAVQLGPTCEGCHVTDSWKAVADEAFDHEITRYALRGKHRDVECEKCHPSDGASCRIENYERCSVCHADLHLGQFAKLERGAECEPCHSVEGYLPTLYSLEYHQDSTFPLRGAHLAVPCDSCHKQAEEPLLAALARGAPGAEIPARNAQFRFDSKTCVSCHADPHSGSTDTFMVDRGCEACHVEEEWGRVAFDHNLESFALDGKHRDVACIECHPRLPEGGAECVKLKGVPLTCSGCHENPHRGQVASASRTSDCERCHDAVDWRSTPFEHGRDTRFPLVATHAETSCVGCHADSRYEETSSECRDCHVDPHRGELGLSCDRCHTPHSWDYNVEALTTHSATLFPLDGAHSTLDCQGCHDGTAPFEFSSTETECEACHLDEYRSTSNPDHQLLALSKDCSNCHDSRAWAGATINSTVTFDHGVVFELSGAHLGLDCLDCHESGYAGTPRDCIGCHRADFDSTVDPNHRLAVFPSDCTLCHTTTSWLGATFTHDAGYLLEGAHLGLDCGSCHQGGFNLDSTDCYSCHQSDWAEAGLDHQAAGFEKNCASCHNQRQWGRATFDHSPFWRLTGGHRKRDCLDCHADGYAGTSSECLSCHRRDYRRVVDPNHRAAGFGTNCGDCHGTRSWSGAQLDHNEVFYLAGAHRRLDCQACHADGYSGTPRDCYGCHRADYVAVQDPDHRRAGYSVECTDCHSAIAWNDVELDHSSVFPLNGAHRDLECLACHADGYVGTPTDCYSCHRADFDGTRSPDHRAAGLTTDCLQCHTTHGWSNADLDHDDYYPLTGAHVGAPCESCHADGYAGTPSDCLGCHKAERNSTENPDHRAAGFDDCETCHDTTSWQDADFDHDSYYPLTGAHTTIDCTSCHPSIYAGTPSDCLACHKAERDGTENPDHRAAGFNDCGTCHDTTSWQNPDFDHDPYYPLTGAHTTIDCTSCHPSIYAGTPSECADCHLDDYNSAVDPDHASVGFPLDCTTCHDTDRWLGAVFDHDTYWPLTGRHVSLDCTRCHSGGFAGTARECAGCHLDDYEETVNPYHVEADFSLECESCHSTVDWFGARFIEHDSLHFPIYSGSHEGRWGSCQTCHRVKRDYQSFSCTVCHSHRRDKMDRAHGAVQGYEFENSACYSCHPTGEVL